MSVCVCVCVNICTLSLTHTHTHTQVGLTLSHTRGHIWRALMEAVCYGTRACVEALREAGHGADELLVAGGATRSDTWLQMHADVTGLPVGWCI